MLSDFTRAADAKKCTVAGVPKILSSKRLCQPRPTCRSTEGAAWFPAILHGGLSHLVSALRLTPTSSMPCIENKTVQQLWAPNPAPKIPGHARPKQAKLRGCQTEASSHVASCRIMKLKLRPQLKPYVFSIALRRNRYNQLELPLRQSSNVEVLRDLLRAAATLQLGRRYL